MSNTTKPHQLISCGTPETTTVEAVTLILEAGNLLARTASEQWLAILTEAQAAHARMAERELLAAIGSTSTAVTSADAGTLGASRDLLRDWIRAAEGLRDRARMDDGAPVQMIAPRAVLAVFAADLIAAAHGPGKPATEMGSAPTRYECDECELTFESDPAGGVREVEANGYGPVGI